MAKGDRRSGTSFWGLPDPRDEAAYLKPAEAPMTAWAWEFLRRREDYRKRWTYLVGRFLNDRGELDENAIEREREVAEANAIRNRAPFEWTMPRAALGEEFGIDYSPGSGNGLLDPRVDRPPIFKGVNQVITVIKRGGMVRRPKVLIEFDVSIPIGPQVVAAQRELKLQAGRQKHIKPHLAKLPTYLRMLDFQEIGVADKEIGYHLFRDAAGRKLSVSFRDTFQAAHYWKDYYRRLAAA